MTASRRIVIDLKFDRTDLVAKMQPFFPEFEIVDLADPARAGADLSGVEYAIVWKPDEGLFTRAANLKVLFSGGAGVDHMMSVPGLPDIPLVRFVDRCPPSTPMRQNWFN